MVGLRSSVAQEDSRRHIRNQSTQDSLEARLVSRAPASDVEHAPTTSSHTLDLSQISTEAATAVQAPTTPAPVISATPTLALTKQPVTLPPVATPEPDQTTSVAPVHAAQNLENEEEAKFEPSLHTARAAAFRLPIHRRIRLATPGYVFAIAIMLVVSGGGWGAWSFASGQGDGSNLPLSIKKATTTDTQADKPAAPAASASPAAEPKDTFAHLEIASLNIKAPIVPVGKTKQGNMDVPSSAWSVGWYSYGTPVGHPGNAVIAGHLGAPNQDAIFKDLHFIRVGDTVTIRHDNGSTYNYRVTRTQIVNDANAPLNAIFGPSTGSHLNLITCEGTWKNQNYSDRLVVFTDLIP